MRGVERWTQQAAEILPGDRIEVWEQDCLCYVGWVGQVASHLGVLWIVESGTGKRKLISVEDYRLVRCSIAPVAHAA